MIFVCCGSEDYSQTFAIKMKGTPYNLVHRFEHDFGNLYLSYKGELSGKVGVCISGCEIVVEDGFRENCGKVDTLSGRFSQNSYIAVTEGVLKGSQMCLVFIPESKEVKGEIKVTFVERTPRSLF